MNRCIQWHLFNSPWSTFVFIELYAFGNGFSYFSFFSCVQKFLFSIFLNTECVVFPGLPSVLNKVADLGDSGINSTDKSPKEAKCFRRSKVKKTECGKLWEGICIFFLVAGEQ